MKKALGLLFILLVILGVAYSAYSRTSTLPLGVTNHGDSSGQGTLAWFSKEYTEEMLLVLNSGTYPITSGVTVPKNIHLRVMPGAVFDISSGVTLTLPNPENITSSTTKIFTGNGDVKFTGPGKVPVSWFGQDYNALNEAVNSFGTTRKGTLVFDHLSGTTTQYTISTALDLSSYSNITFQIENGAQLYVSPGVSGVTLPSPANVKAQSNQQIVSGTSLFFYTGGEVYPEWFGAVADNSTNCTSGISNALSSIPDGMVFFRSNGTYKHTGIIAKNYVTLKGLNRRSTVLDNTSSTADSITVTGLNSVNIEDLRIVSTGSSSGYAIKGSKPSSETQRYIKLDNLTIGQHLGGIYLQNPLDCKINNVYLGGKGKSESGGIGIHGIDGTTLSIRDCYVTSYESGVSLSVAPYLAERVIVESGVTGFITRTRGVIIEPYFSSIDNYDFYIISNGALIVGYVDSAANKISYDSTVTKKRTTLLADSNDTANRTQSFGKVIHYGTSVPTTGTYVVGDFVFNNNGVDPFGWVCVSSGSPGSWVSLNSEPTISSTYDGTSTAGSTAEVTLSGVSIPKGAWGINHGLYVFANGIKTGSNDKKRVILYIGTSAVTPFEPNNDTSDWMLEAWIYNAGALNSQDIHWRASHPSGVTTDHGNSAFDTTSGVTISIVGQCDNAGDTIILRQIKISRF